MGWRMSFASYVYLLVFLPMTCIGFWLIQRRHLDAALWYLTVASAVFYAYWNPRDLIIAGCSVAANYCVAAVLLRHKRRRWIFITAIAGNLLVLCYYKYLTFLLGLVGVPIDRIALPLGISFFTFTQIAYLADCRANKIRQTEHDPRHYFLFVSFFPHLIAGPILHHSDLFPQFRGRFRSESQTKIQRGSFFSASVCSKK